MSVLDFLLANWADTVKVTTSWITDVVTSFHTSAEVRRSLASKPLREIEFSWTGLEQSKSARMVMQLLRSAEESIEIPLYSDQAVISGIVGAVVSCDPSYKRFYAGQKIVLVSPDTSTVERGVIQTVNVSDITLTGAVAASFPSGSLILPILDTLVSLEHRIPFLTDYYLRASSLSFKEHTGDTSIPASVTTFGDTPSGASLYGNYPILSLPHDWNSDCSIVINRAGEQYIQGKSPLVETQGLRPLFNFNLQVGPLNLEEFWSLLELFDSRRGRCLPFWLVNPVTMFTISQDVTATLQIDALENIDDLDFFEYVAVLKKDGTMQIRQISATADLGGGVWRITPSIPFVGVSLADVDRVTSVHLVRFSQDSLVESWASDGYMTTPLILREITEEEDVTVVGL